MGATSPRRFLAWGSSILTAPSALHSQDPSSKFRGTPWWPLSAERLAAQQGGARRTSRTIRRDFGCQGLCPGVEAQPPWSDGREYALQVPAAPCGSVPSVGVTRTLRQGRFSWPWEWVGRRRLDPQQLGRGAALGRASRCSSAACQRFSDGAGGPERGGKGLGGGTAGFLHQIG